jgi:hypothetical protein
MGGWNDPSLATLGALNQFQQLQQPVIQNQAALMGLGTAPHVMQATSMGLSEALTPLLQSDLQNKLAAVSANQQEEQLNQSAASLAANIGNMDAQRRMSAFQNAGNLLLGGAANVYAPGAQLEYGGRTNALQGLATGGQLQQDTAQNAMDAQRAEFLRLQGLSEGSSSGMLGGFSPTTGSSTNSTGGK